MAQFDVHPAFAEGTLVVDCQSDVLDDLATRIVIPLYPSDGLAWRFPRLSPEIRLGDENLILATPDMATVGVSDLGPVIGSVADQRYVILNAIDFLLTGS